MRPLVYLEPRWEASHEPVHKPVTYIWAAGSLVITIEFLVSLVFIHQKVGKLAAFFGVFGVFRRGVHSTIRLAKKNLIESTEGFTAVYR